MNRRTLLATVVAVLAMPAAALVAIPASAAGGVRAASAGTAVTVRVEGVKRTLLLPKLVRTGSGWVTRGGAPSAACPDKSAQGALDVATKHDWGGPWETSQGSYEIFSILGETHTFASLKDYWEIFANNVPAAVGACELHLRRGEQLLFAAVPQTGNAYPTAMHAPTNALVGIPFSVKVVWFNAKGKAEPLAKTRITGSGVSTETNSRGVATVIALHPGSLVLHAEHTWSASTAYIRAVPVTVHVA